MTMEVVLIAVVVSVACALCGVFLVLRRISLMSDAISHSVILGIVLGYFLSRTLSSFVPFVGAVIAGICSVICAELLQKTGMVKSDAAVGLVFPAMFGLGVILVSLYAGNVHLDTDAVLLGEIGLAPLDRVSFFAWSLPRSLVQMGSVLCGLLLLLALFFKELKISTFDPVLATSLGFSPTLINYGLMLAVSITCVGAFDSVGAVLVIALMITPPAAALLLTDNLLLMLVLASLLASCASISGLFLAVKIDGSIAGAMATMAGVLFALVYLFSPKHGVVRRCLVMRALKLDLDVVTLAVHLATHRYTVERSVECAEVHLTEHVSWSARRAARVVRTALRRGMVERHGALLLLTAQGVSDRKSVV